MSKYDNSTFIIQDANTWILLNRVWIVDFRGKPKHIVPVSSNSREVGVETQTALFALTLAIRIMSKMGDCLKVLQTSLSPWSLTSRSTPPRNIAAIVRSGGKPRVASPQPVKLNKLSFHRPFSGTLRALQGHIQSSKFFLSSTHFLTICSLTKLFWVEFVCGCTGVSLAFPLCSLSRSSLGAFQRWTFS